MQVWRAPHAQSRSSGTWGTQHRELLRMTNWQNQLGQDDCCAWYATLHDRLQFGKKNLKNTSDYMTLKKN
jgi:hypothetical protein